jgi:lambda repressor-like predicted transcriptional regulator
MDITRDDVLAWLKGALKQNDESATALARRAGVAQSTLTRFLDEENPGGMLNLRTISKIAHAVRSAPKGFKAGGLDLTAGGLGEPEGQPFDKTQDLPAWVRAAIEMLTQGRNAADVWTLTSHALTHAGYLPGDLLVVDLGIPPAAGDVVCAQHHSWSTSSADTIFRIYEPPYLIAASIDPMVRRPLPVDGERVIIKGVVTEMLRLREMR